MNALSAVNTAPTMASMELVEYINAERQAGAATVTHANFLKKVPLVLGGAEVNFYSGYLDKNGQERRCYNFPKREACLMAMSYSYELQAKVFDRMTELEGGSKVPLSYAEALRLAADTAEKLEQQMAAIAIAAPKVAFVEKYVEADGLYGFREVCKLLRASEAKFRKFLLEQRIMYRLGSDFTAYQPHIDAQRFAVRTGVNGAGRSYVVTKFTAKGVDWVAGEYASFTTREARSITA